MTNEWQPIETAPKNGTDIDLWADGYRYADCFWLNWKEGYWAKSNGPDTDTHRVLSIKPTHWMPLPEGPKR